MLRSMSGSDERRDAERVRVPGDLQGEVLVYPPMTVRELSLVGTVIEMAFPSHPSHPTISGWRSAPRTSSRARASYTRA